MPVLLRASCVLCQLERKRVEHETLACVVCGEPFTPQCSDAKTCKDRRRRISNMVRYLGSPF